MDFGVVFQSDPPASRVVDLARAGRDAGFSYVWTFDTHLLWQEPFVIYSQILGHDPRVMVGPMVTNPGTRDWTVIASPVRHAERDVRQPHGLRHRPGRLGPADARRKPATHRRPARLRRTWSASSPTAARSSTAAAAAVPVGRRRRARGLGRGVRAEGACRLTGEVGDGFILQLADPDIAAWMIEAVRRAASDAGRDPDAIKICVAAPAYVGRRPGAPAGPGPVVRRHGRQPRRRHRRPVRRRPAWCRRR